jgi:hypothetical protein
MLHGGWPLLQDADDLSATHIPHILCGIHTCRYPCLMQPPSYHSHCRRCLTLRQRTAISAITRAAWIYVPPEPWGSTLVHRLCLQLRDLNKEGNFRRHPPSIGVLFGHAQVACLFASPGSRLAIGWLPLVRALSSRAAPRARLLLTIIS